MMHNLQHHRIQSGVYGISQDDSPEYIWIIERYRGRWYISKDHNVRILGNYDSVEQAKYFLEINLFLKAFAKIQPWESTANGGTI